MIVSHMPRDNSLTGPGSSASLRSTTIISRLASPWSKRSRSTFDFSIEPDEPLRRYQPGDNVKGHIVLNVLKGFDITHLVIALHGYAKVFKHQQEGQSSHEELVNGKGTRGFEYHGNGLASLFQDEQTLCGSGFLRKQVYKFGFELEFPSKGLPSALDFERGTVAYMISATVTRPTTIAPTSTRCHKIHFRDRIDIESMYTPKTRVISLEPVSRRGKMKKVKTSSTISVQDHSSRATPSKLNTQIPGDDYTVPPSVRPPLSPAPSDHTVATETTTSTGSYHVLENSPQTQRTSPHSSDTRSGETSSSAHTITATTELPRFGALAGDVVPIRVSVTHTKPRVRGVVIATLYRIGRVDMHPVLPLASKGKDKKQEYEDVYPVSRTGLGGLYFANSSPSSAFRKDLSQSSTMMIVNPNTLTADVKISVKVPDEAFPTISNVPGGMISFTYHVEVVIDLTGKLGESKFLPSLTSAGPTFSTGSDNGNQMSSAWANSILDTTALRRMRSVVPFELPLVVGTMDSRRARQQQMKTSPAYRGHALEHHHHDNTDDANDWQNDSYGPEAYRDDEYYDGYYYDEYGNPLHGWYDQSQEDYNGVPPPDFVPPPPEEPEPVDEKTRMRRHEALLLPSQPPDAGENSRAASGLMPSAPSFLEPYGDPTTPMASDVARPVARPSVSRASVRSTETIVPHNVTPPPRLPDHVHVGPSDDKQELERRRLMAQASGPPSDDIGEGSTSVPSAPPATAPTIDDDEYIVRALHHQHLSRDQLPQYQR